MPGFFAAPHPPAQLVKLSEPEPLRVLDDHDGGRGHVDTDLDHRRRHQEVGAALGKGGHGGVLLRRLHAAVDQRDTVAERLGEPCMAVCRGGEVQGFRLLHQRADPVDLGAGTARAAHGGNHLLQPLQRHGAGLDGGPAGSRPSRRETSMSP